MSRILLVFRVGESMLSIKTQEPSGPMDFLGYLWKVKYAQQSSVILSHTLNGEICA